MGHVIRFLTHWNFFRNSLQAEKILFASRFIFSRHLRITEKQTAVEIYFGTKKVEKFPHMSFFFKIVQF